VPPARISKIPAIVRGRFILRTPFYP
jgi:hypothetical protein